MTGLGFSEAKQIYINKSLTQKNKELFKDCLKFKKISQLRVPLDQCWKDFLEKKCWLLGDTCQLFSWYSIFLRDKGKWNLFELL